MFDLEGARRAGYSDADIASHLAKSSGYDLDGAHKAGYSDAAIIEHLATKQSAQSSVVKEPVQAKVPSVSGLELGIGLANPAATLINLLRLNEQQPAPREAIRKTIGYLTPTVEALGAAGGGALGLASPIPGGTAIGAGLGYGAARQGMRAVNELLGYEKPRNLMEGLTASAEDVLLGGSMEAGGQIVARNVLPHASKFFGFLVDAAKGNLAKARAGMLAREAAGQDLPAIKGALSNADDLTAAQATANINSPTWQAAAKRAEARDPRFFGAGQLTPRQEAQATNVLTNLARGDTQTSMRASQEKAVDVLNKRLVPVLKTELEAANTAGRMKPKLDAEAQRFGEAAASKVEDVRRFTAAGERAGQRAATTTTVPGYPRVPGRYTYMGELEKKAEQVTAQAADASLPFGEASRFAKAASDSLEAHGLRPLESSKIIGAIKNVINRPEFAGNRDVSKVMTRVGEDIIQWTNEGGVIDAWALDAIRKNSVNGVIRELYPSAETRVQKELAAKMLVKLKPLVVDVIEKAGGTGYGQYLKDYSAGRQLIDQSKLGAEAVNLFKNNPKKFVELVEGNSPDVVESIFGSGNYDLAKQMSAKAMNDLRSVADTTKRGLLSAEQSNLGQNALRDLLEVHNPRLFKIPWGLSPKTMAMNKALDMAERNIGRETMNVLTEGMKSGKSALEVLNTLPSNERIRVLKVLKTAQIPAGMTIGTVNALSVQD